jgi:hypothetical protein
MRRLTHKELRHGWEISDPSSDGPVAYLRDLDGSGSYHVCARGDPGAFPVFELVPVETVADACGEVIAAELGECGQFLATQVARAALSAIAAAARQGGDVKQAPGEAPQSGGDSRIARKDIP